MTTEDIDPSLWIRRYAKASDADRRLVCFPHAGGSASFFHPLAQRFAADTDVVSLQYPGRQDRRHEPLITDIGSYADRLTAVLTSMTDVPTVFFGHSMGAVLAFEVARRLEDRGAAIPSSLIVSGRRAPATCRDEQVHRQDDQHIIAELKLLNGTGAQLFGDEEVMRMALPAIRGDYQAIETYACAPRVTVRCAITVLVGRADPKATLDESAAWRDHTTGDFRLKSFPGGHFFLSEHQSAVNGEIAAELGKLSPVPSQA
ncbi:thioesterase II family protein [Amycolatopsis sp. H20-H5]|uniref:thioesterase II family protein n=1 Tax=Amycolatopsis sp. H20-H5 TaxID=3046309 RepID=UPI002DBC5674|nr:alpha/beta fold hydrolase [Amycolatopsis sp. H20-H5]MEC3981278.1 alpha/beta fold hydrolase [Amycolatopsis sp. H20-H5]